MKNELEKKEFKEIYKIIENLFKDVKKFLKLINDELKLNLDNNQIDLFCSDIINDLLTIEDKDKDPAENLIKILKEKLKKKFNIKKDFDIKFERKDDEIVYMDLIIN